MVTNLFVVKKRVVFNPVAYPRGAEENVPFQTSLQKILVRTCICKYNLRRSIFYIPYSIKINTKNKNIGLIFNLQ